MEIAPIHHNRRSKPLVELTKPTDKTSDLMQKNQEQQPKESEEQKERPPQYTGEEIPPGYA